MDVSNVGWVIQRTRSQETFAAPNAPLPGSPAVAPIPYAVYPPDLSEVHRVVSEQASHLASVSQDVDQKTKFTYEQLVLMHQAQQHQAAEQMAMNQKLLEELSFQRQQQQKMAETLVSFQDIPKAPTFSGSTAVQKRKFMDQYEVYMREVALANAQRVGSTQIVSATLSSCIDPILVNRIAYWEMNKDASEICEDDWRKFFLAARNSVPLDMTKLDSAYSRLKMDVHATSAESRVSKLVNDYEVILSRLSLEGFAEEEPKLTVEYLVAAIMPHAYRQRVKELLKLQSNHHLKKNSRRFKIWLAEFMKRAEDNLFSVPPRQVEILVVTMIVENP